MKETSVNKSVCKEQRPLRGDGMGAMFKLLRSKTGVDRGQPLWLLSLSKPIKPSKLIYFSQVVNENSKI